MSVSPVFNVFDDLGYPQSDQYDCEDSGNRKQDIKQLPELCQLRTVLIFDYYYSHYY